MSSSIKGLTVEINGDVTQLNKALATVNANSKDLQSELKSVEKLLKFDPTNTELLAQKQTILAKSVQASKEKLDTLKLATEQAQTKLASGDMGEEQFRALEREVIKTEQSLSKLEAQAQSTESEEKQLDSTTEKLGKEMDNAAEKGGLLKKIFAGGFLANIATQALNTVVNTLKNFATAALKTADQLKGLTAETGLSSTELQKLRYIGEDVGVSVETMATSMKRIVKSMNAARDGAGDQADAYKKLKVEVVDAQGALRDGNTVYGEVLDALGKMTNETERDALAQIVLGRSATELNAIIELGADGMKELGDQAESTGAIMSEDAVTALDNLGDAIDHAKQSAESFVGEGLAKIIEATKTVASLTDAATTLDEMSKGTDETTQSMAASAVVAEQYIDKLDELAKSGLETADAQSEYKNTVDQLNSIIPDLGVTINSETGLIDQNTASLRENVQAWKENAIAQALTDAYSAAIKEAASNQLELTTVTIAASAAQANLDVVYQQIIDRMGLTGQAATDMKARMSAGMEWDALTEAANQAGISISDLSDNYFDNNKLLEEAVQKEDKYQKVVDKSTDIIKSYDSATKGAQASLFETLGVTEDTTDATDDSTTATRKLSSEVDGLSDALSEQAENGELSFSTIMDLIDAGYAAALQVNSETGAVTLNRDAYIALAQAKIQDQIATLNSSRTSIQGKLISDGTAALNAAGDFVILAGAKALANDADYASYKSITAQIGALSSLSSKLSNMTVAVKSAGGGASSAASKADDAAKKAEAAFDTLFKSLKEKFKSGQIDLKTFIQQSGAARDQYLKKNTDAWTESYEDMFDQVKDVMSDRLKDIKSEYDDALGDIQDKIDDMKSNLLSIGDITETIKFGDSEYIQLSNLDKQTASITAFGDALTALKKRGVSADMLSEIAAMDVPEGTKTANLLLGLSDDQWASEMKAWDAKQAAAKVIAEAFYADDIKTLNDSLVTAVGALQTKMTDAGLKLGGNITDGIVNGIKAGTLNVEASMSAMMDSALTAAKTTAKIASPSKVARDEIGKQLPAGVAEGITKNKDQVDKAMASLMNIVSPDLAAKVSYAVAPSPNSSGASSDSSITAEVGAAIAAGLAAIGDVIYDAIPKTHQTVLNGKVIAAETWDDFEEAAKNKNKIFAASREAVASIARSVT